VATLSRDAANANNSISPIFDKEKEQKRLQTAQLVGEIASQAMNITTTEAQINATTAANAKVENVSQSERNAVRKALQDKDPTKVITADDVTGRIYSDAYETALTESGWQTGGKNQRAMQAAAAVIQGLAGGDIKAAIAGGAAPYIAHEIGSRIDDAATKVIAHAVVNAALAAAQDRNMLAAAGGAATGELVGMLAGSIYHKNASELTEQERTLVSTFATLASGLAGGLIGDSGADTVTAAAAGKNTVENNALHADDEKQRQDTKWSLPYLEGEKKQQAEKLISDLDAKDKAFDTAIEAACQNMSSNQCKGLRQDLAAMANSYDELLDGEYIGKMRSVYKDGAKQVDDLMWQYATADAQAKRDADIKLLATMHEISPESAKTLYYTMAGVHTTAAIGGAAYGMKGSSLAAKGSTSVVESEKAALDRISQNAKDTVNLNSKQNYSVLDQQAAKSSVIIEQDKLKYLFGEVNSSAHNTPRSTQLAQSMYRLGIPLDDAGAKLIMEHISQIPKTSGNIVNVYTNQFGKFEVRESLLMGPSGKAAKLETSFQIMDNGSRRFVTTIPKDGKK